MTGDDHMGVWTMAGRCLAAVAVGAAITLGGVATVRADDFVDRANALYSNIQKERRSDLVILPLLHDMDAAPKAPGDYLAAALMTTQNVDWNEAVTWVKGAKQQAVLAGLKKVTEEDDWRKAWEFGQPYGAGALEDAKFVDMKLYTELGEDNLLVAAQVLYLPAVRKMELLCHVEATRLLAEGKGDDALELMRRWAWFSYQIANRQLLKEKLAGMEMLGLAFARMRDLAYTDMMAEQHSITVGGLTKTIAKLGERNPINIERLGLPGAERLAAHQLVSRTFDPGEKGRPNPSVFVKRFAEVAAGQRPLRRFSESAKWKSLMSLHGSTSDTMKQIDNVYGDWDRRWDLNQWDPIQEIATDYQRLDKVEFAALDLVMGDVGQVFPKRRELRAEWIGTRTALGVYGYRLKQNTLPVSLASLVPDFIGKPSLMIDPFDKDAKEDRGKRLGYVRAGVDNMAVGGTSKPVTIRVFPRVSGVEYPNFEAKVMLGQALIYSAGPDGNQNGCERATQMVKDDHGDYLVWPPVLSLARQYRIDNATKPEDRP